MAVSTSTNSHPSRRATIGPTELLPVAMKPVMINFGVIASQRAFAVSVIADLFEEAFEVARDLGQRIAAELIQKRRRQFKRHHGLRDHRGGRNRTDVATLVSRLRAIPALLIR